MVDQQELDRVREEYFRKLQEEQQRIQEAAITYFKRRIEGQDATLRDVSNEYHISYWKLRAVVRGNSTQALSQEQE